MPLQDAAHALLLQKLVHDSVFLVWILHEPEDGTKHVLTLLVVEMERGMCQRAPGARQTTR